MVQDIKHAITARKVPMHACVAAAVEVCSAALLTIKIMSLDEEGERREARCFVANQASLQSIKSAALSGKCTDFGNHRCIHGHAQCYSKHGCQKLLS